jgi:hypothetical protein
MRTEAAVAGLPVEDIVSASSNPEDLLLSVSMLLALTGARIIAAQAFINRMEDRVFCLLTMILRVI